MAVNGNGQKDAADPKADGVFYLHICCDYSITGW